MPNAIYLQCRQKGAVEHELNSSRKVGGERFHPPLGVEVVPLVCDQTKILGPVVGPYAVYVVNLHSVRDGLPEPRIHQSVSVKFTESNAYQNVLLRGSIKVGSVNNGSGRFASIGRIRNIHASNSIEVGKRPFFPRKGTSGTIEIKSLSQVFLSWKRSGFSAYPIFRWAGEISPLILFCICPSLYLQQPKSPFFNGLFDSSEIPKMNFFSVSCYFTRKTCSVIEYPDRKAGRLCPLGSLFLKLHVPGWSHNLKVLLGVVPRIMVDVVNFVSKWNLPSKDRHDDLRGGESSVPSFSTHHQSDLDVSLRSVLVHGSASSRLSSKPSVPIRLGVGARKVVRGSGFPIKPNRVFGTILKTFSNKLDWRKRLASFSTRWHFGHRLSIHGVMDSGFRGFEQFKLLGASLASKQNIVHDARKLYHRTVSLVNCS